MVNGREGGPGDWDAVQWRRVDKDARRLRQRIFAASQAGGLNKVRNLQKLMLRSRANALHSVRRVTEQNAGRAGVDGNVEWEARSSRDPADSGRAAAAHDAIKAIHQAGKGRNAKLPVKIAISSICAEAISSQSVDRRA